MFEFILNGDFADSSGTTAANWTNGPGAYEAFNFATWEMPMAIGNAADTDLVQYALYQAIVLPTGAVVVAATMSVWRRSLVWEGSTYQGSCVNTIRIQKPDTSYVTVKTETLNTGGQTMDWFFQDEDVLSTFDAAGTYNVYLYCDVRSSDHGGSIETNRTYYDFISLAIEYVMPGEGRLYAGKTDKKIYTFLTGSETGRYDTDDLDFGYPDMEKTLEYISFEGGAVASHTVTVYVSTDSGRSWTNVGNTDIRSGTLGQVYPWITGEKFRLSFRGDGLYLHSITARAIPLGPLKETEL